MINFEHINVGVSDVTFFLFHGDIDDYKREFIVPLEETLIRRSVKQAVIDFGRLSFISKQEAVRIKKLIQILELLDLPFIFRNIQPSVSLSFSRWEPEISSKGRRN